MKVGDKIKAARVAAGLSQAQLASDMGVTVQAISQWETGKSTPSSNRLLSLAGILKLPANDLLQDGPAVGGESWRGQASQRYVPIISRVHAGAWHPTMSLGQESADWINVSWQPKGPTFALEVNGESMLPEFRSGDVIIVDTGLEPMPGDYVVAALEGESEATFKKYRPRGFDDNGEPVIELAPLNPDYPTLMISAKQPGRIIGTMFEHRRFRRRG